MRKNVSIVTFHKAHNYGAVLQAYALKYNLNKLGYNSKFHNYSPDWIINNYALFPTVKNEGITRSVKRKIGYLLDIKNRFKRYSRFNAFISKHLETWECDDNNIIDCIVIGSDQVWNPKITNGFDKECFGLATWQKNIPSVSYAASMETLELNNEDFSTLKQYINNLSAIGVRESSLKDYMLELESSLMVEHNLDPTLLLNKEEWRNVFSKKTTYSKGYVLVYENYKTIYTNKITKDISDKLNLDVKIITAGASRHIDSICDTSASPEDFIALFDNATFVITTSYHGLAFAINFNKEFICLKVDNGVNNRADSLLSLLSLESNMVDPKTFRFDDYQKIDYHSVNKRLETQRILSNKYLLDAIG